MNILDEHSDKYLYEHLHIMIVVVGGSVGQLVRMSIFLTLLIGREPVSGSGSGEVCTVCTDW